MMKVFKSALLLTFVLTLFFCVGSGGGGRVYVYGATDEEDTTVSAAVPADIDGDGMPNTWELTYFLDPANSADAALDTDFDGLTNLEEYNRGTDPTDDDTDGGGTNDGDEVLQSKDPLNSADDLVTPVSCGDSSCNGTETCSTCAADCGACPAGKEAGDPDDDAGPKPSDKDSDGVLDADEEKYGTNPRNPDTDGDGVLDKDELFKYNTNPNSRDTDLDGLSDFEEIFVYHTDPRFFDTDGDGYSDGDEVISGASPLMRELYPEIFINFYLNGAEHYKKDSYMLPKIETSTNIPISLEVENRKDVVGTTVRFDKEVLFFESGIFNFELVSPERTGPYFLLIQFLNEDGTIDQIVKIVEVKPRGVVVGEYRGFLRPVFRFLRLDSPVFVSEASVVLHSYIEGKDTWVQHDTRVFRVENPQKTLKDGTFLFLVAPGKYRIDVFGSFNNKIHEEDLETEDSFLVNKYLRVKLGLLDYIFTLIKTRIVVFNGPELG
jgi:hypothetical protein